LQIYFSKYNLLFYCLTIWHVQGVPDNLDKIADFTNLGKKLFN